MFAFFQKHWAISDLPWYRYQGTEASFGIKVKMLVTEQI